MPGTNAVRGICARFMSALRPFWPRAGQAAIGRRAPLTAGGDP